MNLDKIIIHIATYHDKDLKMNNEDNLSLLFALNAKYQDNLL